MNVEFELAEARRDAQNATKSNNRSDFPRAQARVEWLESEDTARRNPVVVRLAEIRAAIAAPHRRRDPLVAVLADAVATLLATEAESVAAAVRAKREAFEALAGAQARADSTPRRSSLTQSAGLPAGYRPPTASEIARASASPVVIGPSH